MDITKIIIGPINGTEEIPYNLLLLSDDTKEAIDKNLINGELYLGKYEGQIMAAFILKVIQINAIEIRNIAVSEGFQGKGIGSILLNFIKETAKKRGFQKLFVGTCDQCEKEIKFYKKSGFKFFEIRKNYFLENYDEPIYENGKQIIDMILLKINL